MATKSLLPGMRKFVLALIGTVVGAVLTLYLVQGGETALDAAIVAAAVTAPLWAFIGIEGGRDIVRTWRKPE